MNVEVVKAPSGVRADRGQSHQSIERAALNLRRRIASDVPLNKALPVGWELFDRVDKCKVAGERVGLEAAAEDLPAGIEGLTRYDPRRKRIIISLSRRTYRALERNDGRARFSLAHELGHAVLHCEMLMREGAVAHQMAALRRGEPLRHEKFEDTEWQANTFASALLMPAMGLASVERTVAPFPLSVQAVADVFVVSDEAAMYRIDNFRTRRTKLLRA
jgi:hypothetical protein